MPEPIEYERDRVRKLESENHRLRKEIEELRNAQKKPDRKGRDSRES
jgi:hypothetical protein